MGKQMTRILKGKAEKLYAMYPVEFTEDFEKNKAALNRTGLFDYSKTDRNVVAGYLTRLVLRENKKED